MISECPQCGALLGPSEHPSGCITCCGIRPRSNQDRVIAVLEEAGVPIAHWDVRRLLERSGRRVNPGSLQVWLSTDGRACWGGPGVYGLYRHGLIPGPRDLGTIAAAFLWATDTALTQEEVCFVLQYAGYRFQSTSMYLALTRAQSRGLIQRNWGGWFAGDVGFANLVGFTSGDDVGAVLMRTRSQVEAGLAERERRLT